MILFPYIMGGKIEVHNSLYSNINTSCKYYAKHKTLENKEAEFLTYNDCMIKY